MRIEQDFDVSLIAAMALREKQIQQTYRPFIGVHKWFARRPGTLFRGLILAEFGRGRLRDLFYRSNDFAGKRIADPFMGGGTSVFEASRVGCDIDGFDINPMSPWIVREELESLDVAAYERTAQAMMGELRAKIERYYQTSCPIYGDADVPVKSFLWVKTHECAGCGESMDLFPGYVLAENQRHPKNVLVCWACGDLNEVEDRREPGSCAGCGSVLKCVGPARRGRCDCPNCGQSNTYPGSVRRPPAHRLFAIEYFNPTRKAGHSGRFFKKPDAVDLDLVAAAAIEWEQISPRFVPDQAIPPGDETGRLHRWGYTHYRDMFNSRQLLGLELSCRLIAETEDPRMRRALATNLSDLLRYQNMLCRYDAMTLKALDIFSVHGFPVGLVQCESNLLGIATGTGSNVGSGGWSNIVTKYLKAKRYSEAPYEVLHDGRRNIRVPIAGERISQRHGNGRRRVALRCASATECQLPPSSLDAVFTDPPYFGNVQYGELMDFCYVWLRNLVGRETAGFDQRSSRSPGELTGNVTQKRGLEHFATGLSEVYSRMAAALKPGAPLVFTYHHNKIEAYCAVGVAILDAGMVCSAALPCPAEMGGSIHIHGTSSSIVDTVFVCRAASDCPGRRLFYTFEEIAGIVGEDLAQLTRAGRKSTHGDARCIVLGHLTRMAVWEHHIAWDRKRSITDKLTVLKATMSAYGDQDDLANGAFAAEPAASGSDYPQLSLEFDKEPADAVPV